MTAIFHPPLVSVIIPAYNGDRYIVQAVESVLQQSYRNFEIVVIDDGSTDQTRQVLDPYFDRLRYVYQDNQGVAAARNRGLEVAQGKYIAFLDQDDCFLPKKLSAQVVCLEAQPEIDIVNSGWRVVDSEGEFISDFQLWENIPNLELADWVLWKPILLGAMLFRREGLEGVGGFDSHFEQADDIDWVLRLVQRGCLAAWVRQATLCYRKHDGNASRNTPKQGAELQQVLDKFFALPVSAEISQLEPQSRYQSWVWGACRLYSTGYQEEMADYLERSLRYSPYPTTHTILNWVQSLKLYASQYGYEFDGEALSRSVPWQQLTRALLVS